MWEIEEDTDQQMLSAEEWYAKHGLGTIEVPAVLKPAGDR